MARRRADHRDPTAEKVLSQAFKEAMGQLVASMSDRDCKILGCKYRELLEWAYGLNGRPLYAANQVAYALHSLTETVERETGTAHKMLTGPSMVDKLRKLDPDILNEMLKQQGMMEGLLAVYCPKHQEVQARPDGEKCTMCPCGLEYMGVLRTRKKLYCSRECSQAAYRLRVKSGQVRRRDADLGRSILWLRPGVRNSSGRSLTPRA